MSYILKCLFKKDTNAEKLAQIHAIIIESFSVRDHPSKSFSAADLGPMYDKALTDILAVIKNSP